MIIQFARKMVTTDNLKMLYLLTYADIRAVGPDVWNGWKAMLLQELYQKAFQVLERGNFRLEASSERTRNVKRKVTALLEDELPISTIKQELKGMTTRHLLSNSPETLAAHVRFLHELTSHTPLMMKVAHDLENGYSTFTICAFDHPGLFARITGVMAANGMNILGAQIHTGSNGKVLDILQVNSPQGFVITDENRWKRLQEEMEQVLSGVVRVSELVEKRDRPSLLTQKVKPRFPTTVEIDNDISEEYTVIDIYTHDKVGLLYRITSTITELGLYIDVSKISTKVDQVADVFYVKDIFRQKIKDEAKCAEIQARLLAAIDENGTSKMQPVITDA
jgi:[protein-PII] uridylyltransferase